MNAKPILPVLLLLAACADVPSADAATDTAAPTDTVDRPAAPAAPADTAALNAAVRTAVEADGMDPADAPFRTARVELDGDGVPDALALMQGAFCGTGGCTLYVLRGGADGYTLDSSLSLVRGPFVVAESRTDGWRDLFMEVSGGGMPAKMVILRHDAGGYPPNPSMLVAAPAETVQGDVVFSPFEDSDLHAFADFIGQTPQDAGLWNRPFLSGRMRQLLYSHYEAFTARMETVAPVLEQNGVYYVTGNMDNMGGSDAAILVADPTHNVLRAWIWEGGDLTTFSEAPVTIDLPDDVETIIGNMSDGVR